MQRLNRRELGAVLDCLRTIYAALDLEAFPRQVVAGLRRVVSAPFGSYNEIERGATRIRYVVEPAEATVPHLELAVREYQNEQPVVANYLRTATAPPGSSRTSCPPTSSTVSGSTTRTTAEPGSSTK